MNTITTKDGTLNVRQELRAIVQSEHGAPENVLRIAKRELTSGKTGMVLLKSPSQKG